MMNRTTSIVVGALTCMVAGASFVTMHLADAGAADECLAAPRKGASPGQHWYYRVDRATQRHCWYLGAEGKSVARAAKSTSERRATLTDSDREAVLTRSAANVRAEMPMPQASRADDAKAASPPQTVTAAQASGAAEQSPSNGAASDTQKPTDVWRALDAANFQPATSEAPKPSPSASSVAASSNVSAPSTVAPATTDAVPETKTEPPAAPTAQPEQAVALAVAPPVASVMSLVPLTRLDPTAMGRATSLSALFLAAFGALVFVTLAAGLTYFFTDRTRGRQADGRLAFAEDWPVEPFRIPSTLRLSPHDAIADDPLHPPGALQRPDPRRSSRSSDPEVRQIEQLLTRAVRRSETLRGQIDDLGHGRPDVALRG
jgi:hypothetical protein